MPDLTKEDIDELERKLESPDDATVKEAHLAVWRELPTLLPLARAQIEGREAGGELIERLHNENALGNVLASMALRKEAADALAAKEAEVERLREALEEIADNTAGTHISGVSDVARAALGKD